MRKFLSLLVFLSLTFPSFAQDIEKADILRNMTLYESYVEKARLDWGVPQVAVAVVNRQGIVWWKGFGSDAPDQKTVFAIGSTTKAFTAATLAMMIDDGGPNWDARVVDHLPEFAMYDPWVTREFQVKDLLAQHSGMGPQALSALGSMGYSAKRITEAMRWVEPTSSFRSKYGYVNSPHLVAGNLVAKVSGTDSWESFLLARLLKPLGMTSTTWTAEGLNESSNSASGHAWVGGEIQPIPTGPFPYVFGAAGGLNSNLHDMSRWVQFQLGDGTIDGKTLVSKKNLRVTRTPQTVIGESTFYCMGWLRVMLNDEQVIWHNGGTPGHTTFVGIQPERGIGIVVLSNLGGTQMPDAVGLKFFEMVQGIQGPDYSAQFLARRQTPEVKPILNLPSPPELSGRYEHPALGIVEVQEGLVLHFQETGLKAELQPIGPNLFRIQVRQGWLKDVGWGSLGEALFRPAGLSESKSLTVYLGDEGEGSKFQLLSMP